MSEHTEYRAIITRGGRIYAYHDIFPEPDLNWRAYFHDIKQYELVRWEKRTVETSNWSEFIK